MRERLRSEMSDDDRLMDKAEPQTEEYVGGLQEGLRALSWSVHVYFILLPGLLLELFPQMGQIGPKRDKSVTF